MTPTIKRLPRLPAPASSVRYRVEHRMRHVAVLLGELEGVVPHHTTLDPYVSFLLHRGLAGQVVLIDDATGTVVARRRVRPRTGTVGRSRPPADRLIRIQPVRQSRNPQHLEYGLSD